MGLENFIPEFWSDKLFVRLRKSLVFGGVVNRDYEGQIVTVSAYTKNATLSYENLDSAQKQLVIDQASHFAFKIDDIDEAQSNPKLMNGAMDEAAYGVANTIDTFLAGLYTHAGCLDTTNMGSSSSPISVSSGNVILALSFAGRRMSEKNVPEGNRFMIIPPWLHQKLLLAEVGGISATAVPKVFNDQVMSSGYVGDALGFKLLLSNNVQNSASNVSAIMALNRSAITYAGQVSEIEAIRLQTTFANAARGLYLYGGKVTQPDALAALHLTEVAG
jgi:hypothetical protein